MRILLISPPKKNLITTNIPEFIEEEHGYYPPLGLLYLAGYLEEKTEHEVLLIDAPAEGESVESITEKVIRLKPDVVGIQTFTFALIDVIEVARAVKKVNSHIHVCLGGPHVNIYPDETISIDCVDSLVLGEGEEIFADLIEALNNKTSLKDIAGVISKDGKAIHKNNARPFMEDLDSLPFPSRKLVALDKYSSLLAQQSPITTMITSRGCPYKCTFCDRPHLGRLFRYRSAKSVADEMVQCAEMGIKEIFLYDDTFTLVRDRVFDLCDELEARRPDIKWDFRTRVDVVDREMLARLKKVGCQRIHYGVEAGTEEILKVLKKSVKLEKVEEVFKMTRELGITTLAYFMIGSPTETREQIETTIKFALRLNPDFAHFAVTTAFPGTELYADGLKQGILKSDFWREFAKKPRADFVPELWEENLSREELIELLQSAYRQFYSRPSYIFKSILKVRSFGELKRKARAGLKVLRF